MSHTKKIAIPFLVSELFLFDEFSFSDYPCAHHNSVTV